VRPGGVTALAIFFGAGAIISGTSAVALLAPGSFLDQLWNLNPRARTAFVNMGGWSPLLLCVVCLACGLAAVGFWRQRRWGYRLGIGLLVVNLTGDLVNVVLGTEPRAAVGIPIVVLLLVYLARSRVRESFDPI
jgi:hypothetical protein